MIAVDVRNMVRSLLETSDRLRRNSVRALADAARIAKTEAARRAPGKLGRSIFANQESPDLWEVGSTWNKAAYLEFGTKAHTIAPRRARVLAFRVNGAWAFAHEVRHPGNRAYHFMRDGRELGERELQVFASGPLL